MSAIPPTRPASRANPDDQDPASASKASKGSLRWVREVLGRSIRLEQPRNQARRGAPTGEPLSLLMQQRTELGARLLVHDPETQLVRNLFVVHDQLGTSGWAGVETLPPQVIGRAQTEAEILQMQEPSPLLGTIIESLRGLKVAADQRTARDAQQALEREWQKPQAPPEVSETNYDEYELMERSWVGTVPAGL